LAAVFPLMVHDEMDTVPPATWTPPPCKQRAKRVSHKAMGNIEGLCGTYNL
jgi:hypothetical protein